ncbi:MAG: glycoside hydrolase family 25 protein [Lachnospiraceae bacterium]|nr:glycoside hydrolase family 25 protein [Lachnospiraceae bacterium]
MKLRETDERKLELLDREELLDEEELYLMDESPEEPEFYQNEETSQTYKRSAYLHIGPTILAVLGCIALILLIIYIVAAARINHGNDAETAGNMKENYSYEEVQDLLAETTETAKAEEAERILSGIKQGLTDGLGTAKALRPYYTDEIIVATGGRIRFFPIQDNLKKNTYTQENLVKLDNGELQYTEDGQVISHKGIDVSYHQGEIDWQKVAQDGVEFAFLRVGIRGYGTGKVVLDEQFENNVKGALANGIEVGVYFYSQSVNQEEVLEEARVVLEQIAPYRITGPVVYDAEKVDDSRTSKLSSTERTDMAVTFCETVKEAGYRPMIYLNLDTAFSMLELERLEEYDKWLAHYGSEMYYPYDYKIWQYSESAIVDGINGEVDLNISFEEWE